MMNGIKITGKAWAQLHNRPFIDVRNKRNLADITFDLDPIDSILTRQGLDAMSSLVRGYIDGNPKRAHWGLSSGVITIQRDDAKVVARKLGTLLQEPENTAKREYPKWEISS